MIRYDFFISYAEEDTAWAEWIAWQIEEAGCTTVLQAWDFVRGNFMSHMHTAGQESRYTVAVLSPSYIASQWCFEEWSNALKAGKNLQVRVEEFEPTGLFSLQIHENLVGLDERGAKEQLQKLVNQIPPHERAQGAPPHSSQRRKPSSPPPFPGTSSVAPHHVAPKNAPLIEAPPSFPGTSSVAVAQRLEFYDRLNELADTQTASGNNRLVLLDAPSGYGKTRLLTEYLYRLNEQPETMRRRIVYEILSFKEPSYQSTEGFLQALIEIFSPEVPVSNTPQANSTATVATLDREALLEQFIDRVVQVGREAPSDIFLVLEDAHLITGSAFSDWLRKVFIVELHDRLMPHKKQLQVGILVTGRLINAEWRYVLTTQLQVVLPLFQVSHTAEIISHKVANLQLEIDERSIDKVAHEIDRLSAGHPASVLSLLNLLIDQKKMAVNFGNRDLSSYFFAPDKWLSLYNSHVRPHIEEVLEDLRNDRLWDTYKVLSVFRCFFAGLIPTLQDRGFISEQVKPLALIDRLQETGYVKLPGPLGFFHDNVLRRVIALHMRVNEPDVYRELNDFAFEYWGSLATNSAGLTGQKLLVSDDKQIRCILEAVYHFVTKLELEQVHVGEFMDNATAANVLAKVSEQLKFYANHIRSSTGPLDTNILMRYLVPMLIADHELENKVKYLLGTSHWEQLVAVSREIVDIQ